MDLTTLHIYQEVQDDIEGLFRCHREAINAEERIFWPLQDLLRAVNNKVENLRSEA